MTNHPDHSVHSCLRNDGECVCTCYAEGFAKGVERAKGVIKEFQCPPECNRDTMDHDGFREGINKSIDALNELTDKS